jgi:uncharacterized membrane protein YciS (DUF1049 family)
MTSAQHSRRLGTLYGVLFVAGLAVLLAIVGPSLG